MTRRGRTARGRLGALDRWLLTRARPLLEAPGPAPVVDLGFGHDLATALEFSAALAAVSPSPPFIGVEADPARLAAARAQHPELDLRRGDFELGRVLRAPARLIRVCNVLRGYREAEALLAHRQLAASLAPGGLLVEGSADLDGHRLVCHLISAQETGPRREALLFHTRFLTGFAPLMFRDRLPRDLRAHARAGGVLHPFFEAWVAAWMAAREAGETQPEAAFLGAATRFAAQDDAVDATDAADGYLLWRPPGGVPHGV